MRKIPGWTLLHPQSFLSHLKEYLVTIHYVYSKIYPHRYP
jgi:hypothetical protein